MMAKTWAGRIIAAKVVMHPTFEALMASVFAINVGTIVWETDYAAQCFPNYSNDEAN